MEKDFKLYYSISEVAKMFNLNVATLRFWEKEFPQLSPKKKERGKRHYNKEDIETIKLIYHLVKVEGMTLPGARTRLATKGDETTKRIEVIERLQRLREELLAIKKELDHYPNSSLPQP
ncbi:MerR family transcriptional regulator [Bacteroides sp. 214]|uniref:MerR family transcriptional regulator n=1 Tax=Bacteroides sp. 214 TaxID=2302935 RepID=UPI0013D6C646|nr:MerR family transcriptional regulator [Bacteroides sp. 214]NDW12308.1 MerR family transcriptional regulator [Bacteroides sp. 214]